MRPADPSPPRRDPASFIFGTILVAVALLALVEAVRGPLSMSWLKIGAPIFLVLVGIVGLVLSRPRS